MLGGFQPGDDPDQARWAASIAGQFHTVSGIVGTGFSRYLRLFHPAYLGDPDDGTVVGWERVAHFNERVFHPLAVWGGISPYAVDEYNDGQIGVYDHPPMHGCVPRSLLRALVTLLSAMADPPAELWFGYWEGMGWDRGRLPHTDLSFDLLPERTGYLLYRGDLDCLTRSVVAEAGYQSVHMCWPHDHRWVLGVDVDLNSSYLGCGEDLFGAVRGCPDIESGEVFADSPVSIYQDTINAVVNPTTGMLTRER